jgi:hypothetical protein
VGVSESSEVIAFAGFGEPILDFLANCATLRAVIRSPW